MAKIYRRSDRIAVKVDDITVHLAPLTLHQKTDVQQAMIAGRMQTDIKEASRGIALSIKYAVKGIDGVECADGKPYTLEFNGDDLTDACVDDLLNLELVQKLAMICGALANGIPSEFTDSKGNPIEGVEIFKPQKEDASKNV